MKKQIIEKIRKLLALANSDNEHEAQIASKRAQQLLLKHNIDLATVKQSEAEFVKQGFELRKRRPVEMKFVHSILAEFFCIEIVYSRKDKLTYFLGSEENVQIATYVESFLMNAFKSIYKVEAKKRGWSNGAHRNSFYLGMYKGLREKLEAQKEDIVASNPEAGNALMVIDKKLTTFVQKAFSNLRTESNRRINANPEAVEAGKEHGRNLNISRGLGSRNESSSTLALGGN